VIAAAEHPALVALVFHLVRLACRRMTPNRCSSGWRRCSWRGFTLGYLRSQRTPPLSNLQEDDSELVQQWLAAVQLAQVGMDRLVGTLEIVEGAGN